MTGGKGKDPVAVDVNGDTVSREKDSMGEWKDAHVDNVARSLQLFA